MTSTAHACSEAFNTKVAFRTGSALWSCCQNVHRCLWFNQSVCVNHEELCRTAQNMQMLGKSWAEFSFHTKTSSLKGTASATRELLLSRVDEFFTQNTPVLNRKVETLLLCVLCYYSLHYKLHYQQNNSSEK